MSRKKKIKEQKVNEAQAEEQLKYCDAVQYARVRDHQRFNVGDVLIRRERDKESGKWLIETDGDFDLPVKYKYVYESEDGHGIVVQLDSDGTWCEDDGDEYMSLAGMIGPDCLFEVDPDYADHVLMGEQGPFDPGRYTREKEKEFEEIDKFNKTLVVSIPNDDYVAANKAMATLKVGQNVWVYTGWGSNPKANVRNFVKEYGYNIKRIRKVKMTEAQVERYLRPKNKKERKQKFYYYTMLITGTGKYASTKRINTMNLAGGHIMTGNPRLYESVI